MVKSMKRSRVPAIFIITSLSPPHVKQFTLPQQSTTFGLKGVKRQKVLNGTCGYCLYPPRLYYYIIGVED